MDVGRVINNITDSGDTEFRRGMCPNAPIAGDATGQKYTTYSFHRNRK